MNKLKYILFTVAAGAILVILLPLVFPLASINRNLHDYRIPYDLGENYFLYHKFADKVSESSTIPVIGDSVIWGHYVSDTETLTSYLNSKSAAAKFSNLGIDGIHPAAMYGLADNFCKNFTGKKIIVGINLLWMSSPRHDLSGAKNSEINHRLLLPQFTEKIPAYQPSFEDRLSNVMKRESPFLLWIDHLKLTQFRGRSFYRWSMDNPSDKTINFFKPEYKSYEIPVPMDFAKLPKQKIEWISPEKSLQWSYTLKTLRLLKKRNNRVMAMVTPFNVYMLTDESIIQHSEIVEKMKTALLKENITAVVLLIPGRDCFADSSHPVAKGYNLIADDLMKNKEFSDFVKN